METEKFILIEMCEPPRIWWSEVLPNESFILNEIEYFDSGNGDFLGFYDFLRNGCSEVIGIRFFPFEDCGLEQKEIEFYFTAEKELDENNSDDQAFGDNKFFKSNDGKILLTFRAPEEKLASNSEIAHAELIELLPKVA